MPVATTDEIETRIVVLWSRRPDLGADEWKEFGRLVLAYLGARNFSHYATLSKYIPTGGYDALRRELIEDFFTDKLFLPAIAEDFQPTTLASARALVNPYYTNYLIDRIRRWQNYRDVLESAGVEEAATRNGELNEDTPRERSGLDVADALDTAESSVDPLRTESVQARDAVADGPGGCQDCGKDALIRPEDVGLSESSIQAAARRFLESREKCDWVIRYLGCHHCVDREDRPALQWLARQHGIPSYARRARELGITKPRGGYTREAPWSDTMLGKWLTGLGIDVEQLTDPGQSRTRRGDQQLVVALKILCRETLKKVMADNCC